MADNAPRGVAIEIPNLWLPKAGDTPMPLAATSFLRFYHGDRMDTDIVAGVVSGLETYLVLSGVTASDAVARFPYRPTKIFESVAFIDP
jgi:hypothetical protein